MSYNANQAKSSLVTLLKRREGILVAGAGLSKVAGLPLWHELLDEMASQLTPELSLRDDTDLLLKAEQIKRQLESLGKLRVYHKFLEREFAPQPDGRLYTDLHTTLVQLGFSGIVTTNYDEVLENSIQVVTGDLSFHPEPIDLCDHQHIYRVPSFLRSLSPSPQNRHAYVLHLHGHHRNPEGIILTESDFREQYGVSLDSNGQSQILDTLHRKVIWALLSMRSLVFVGFSMHSSFR